MLREVAMMVTHAGGVLLVGTAVAVFTTCGGNVYGECLGLTLAVIGWAASAWAYCDALGAR